MGRHRVLLSFALVTLATGCTAITVDPSCPAELRVGERGDVEANEVNPGGIPSYQWEVFPTTAGTFIHSDDADTEFEAKAEGTATIRLTASDGLYQSIAECTTVITGFIDVAVALEAEPSSVIVGDEVTLTCTNNGTVDTTVRAITQLEGGMVELMQVSLGVATFTPTEIGDLTFRCVGEDSTGVQSRAVTVTVTVTQTKRPGRT